MAILKDLIVNGAARILGDTYAGKITATSFVKNGGTSSQFLMADGSVSTHSGVDKVGTVTSVGVSTTANGGLKVSGSPVTSNGTINIDIDDSIVFVLNCGSATVNV